MGGYNQAIARILKSQVKSGRSSQYVNQFEGYNVVTDSYQIYYLTGSCESFEKRPNQLLNLGKLLDRASEILVGKEEFQLDYDLNRSRMRGKPKQRCVLINGYPFDSKLIRDMLDIMGKEAWYKIGKVSLPFCDFRAVVCENERGKSLVLPYRTYGVLSMYPEITINSRKIV